MTNTQLAQEVPIRLVGSSVYGRLPIISSEQTFNLFITTSGDGKEEWLISFAGYKFINEIIQGNVSGRGLFHSIRGNFMIAVIGGDVFRINTASGAVVDIGDIPFNTTEVFMDENLASQIAIVDGSKCYIYNYSTNTFGECPETLSATDLTPNYVTYQNTKFIFGNNKIGATGSQWYTFDSGSGLHLTATTPAFQTLQTKPDYALAAIRIPGAGNNLLVLGTSVAEVWQDIGGAQIYQRNNTMNIDYGVSSVSTIAATDTYVAWLGVNEKSSPSIMIMAGGQAKRISSDGIDFRLDDVNFPDQSTAMFYRQDGHLFYVLTFFHPTDNFTIMLDMLNEKFYDLLDYDNGYYPMRQVAYFQGQTYFVSLKNGTLYESGSDITDMQVAPDNTQIQPAIRITDTFRLPGPEKLIGTLFTFTIQNGVDPFYTNPPLDSSGFMISEFGEFLITEDGDFLVTEDFQGAGIVPRIDVMLSKNGGHSWSNPVPYIMHTLSNYANQPRFPQLGKFNQLTFQLRFHGLYRFCIRTAVLEARQ